jgi:hypothetical protein
MLPKAVDNKITVATPDGTETKVLTAPELSQYQQLVGRGTSTVYRLLLRNERFAALPQAVQAEALAKALKDVNEQAKTVLFGQVPTGTQRATRLVRGIQAEREGK